MQRSFSSPALVLRVKPSGEHREAVFLSAEEGLLSATLFGGPKSRLRSHVSPFNSGLLMTYRDPAKDFRKVSDFDVKEWRPGLRELYERSSAASLIAAAVLAGHGGGGGFTNEASQAFVLANAALDALSCADEFCCERIYLHFMWNWTELLGNRCDLQHCGSCACEFDDDEVLWFIPGEGIFCKNCCDYSERKTVLGPGGRRWLLAVENKSPSEINRFTLDAVSLRELKLLINMLVQ